MGGLQKISQTQRARNEILGFTVSHKPSGFDLMQNCDLPPPSKFFMGPDKSVILSMNRVYNIAGKGEEQDSKLSSAYRIDHGDNERDKMELLKALQASQTRAREAEKKTAVLKKEKEGLSMVLLEEAMHLFAYRQQVKLLELQILHLQQSLWLRQEGDVGSSTGDTHDEETTSVAWVLALVLSLGIGVTTALACRYYL